MAANERRMIASFESGRGNTLEILLPEVDKSIPRLVITDKIVSYTCLFIYGRTGDIDYESIVVPVYLMKFELDGKTIEEYNVTRDSWYSRGIIDDGYIYDDFELTNRSFEPKDANVNLFSTVALKYPHGSGLDAFALRQRGSEHLNAEPHTEKMNTFVDGSPIDDARADLNIAKGVMIHIGGYYSNGKRKKLAGSYGCFGFVPSHQTGTKAKMKKWRKNNSYQDVETSNKEYKKFITKVVKTRGSNKLHVLIKKRNNVDKFKTLEDQ